MPCHPLEILTGAQEGGKSLCCVLGAESSCPKFSWVCQHLLRSSQRKGSTACPHDCWDRAVGCILLQRPSAQCLFSLWKGKQALIGHPLAWKPFRQVLVTILFLWSLACTEEVSRPVWITLPLCECSWC